MEASEGAFPLEPNTFSVDLLIEWGVGEGILEKSLLFLVGQNTNTSPLDLLTQIFRYCMDTQTLPLLNRVSHNIRRVLKNHPHFEEYMGACTNTEFPFSVQTH